VDGLDVVAPTAALLPEAVVARSADTALYAGGAPLGRGRREATIARFDGTGFHVTARRRLGQDAAFMALDGDGRGGLWAVGFTRTPATLRPLAIRKAPGSGWRAVSTPARRAGATLTDVASDAVAGTWAVGYTIGQPGRHAPWALRWTGRRFVDRSPRLRAGERGRLTAASVSDAGGMWIAGSVTTKGIPLPYIARRVGDGWQREALPDVGEGAIADIDVRTPDDGWAVGFRQRGSGMEPLVLRWDGAAWTASGIDGIADDAALLMAGWTGDGGRTTVVGAAWDRPSTRFKGLTARRGAGDGSWIANELASLPGQTGLTAVDGLDGAGAWLAGSTVSIGAAARTCGAGVARTRVGHAGRRATRDARRREARAAARLAPGPGVHDEDPSPRPAGGLAAVPALGPSAGDGLRLRDRTLSAGLPRASVTWGAVVADFDDDGADDIFLGQHGASPRLFLDRGTTFADAGVVLGKVDRHGCAADDVDGSGFPDLYCSVGGRRGTGVKANQLWLDPATSARSLDVDVGRAPEPLGRGRVAAFLDVDGDGHRDLFVGQETERMDGLPSDDRVYLRSGPGRFTAVAGSGMDPALSAWAVSTGDADGDGRTDLLLVDADAHSLRRTGGVRLYRNIGGRFRDVTARFGVRTIGETDAELARLDDDGLADLIQLSDARIRISLSRDGRYRTVFERRIANGVALAVGDVDGDGDADIYLLRQKARRKDHDLLLIDRGGARDWQAVRVPSRHGGVADDVYPIDYDGNGRTDFLALDGRGSGPGPIQLIASYPEREPA
jgi:hypothetical protein